MQYSRCPSTVILPPDGGSFEGLQGHIHFLNIFSHLAFYTVQPVLHKIDHTLFITFLVLGSIKGNQSVPKTFTLLPIKCGTYSIYVLEQDGMGVYLILDFNNDSGRISLPKQNVKSSVET